MGKISFKNRQAKHSAAASLLLNGWAVVVLCFGGESAAAHVEMLQGCRICAKKKKKIKKSVKQEGFSICSAAARMLQATNKAAVW